MNRILVRAGFILFFLSLATGMVSSTFTNPRLGLSAHTIAIISGILIAIVGMIWGHLNLGSKTRSVLTWCWLYTGYVNWLATLLAAISGASMLTPVAGAGTSGSPLFENIVFVLFNTVAITSFVGAILILWGLRGNSTGDAA